MAGSSVAVPPPDPALHAWDPAASQALAARVARGLAERRGEAAVIGLAGSGEAAARLLRRLHFGVYASDAGTGDAVRVVADRLAAEGVAVQVGGHDLARVTRATLVVTSPGVPFEAAPLAAARAAGVPVVSEVEVALRCLPSMRYVAVTGTNGKTTVTALVGQLLRALGHDAPEAGNIGLPVSALAVLETPPRWASLELSSYQLHDTPGVRPDVAVLTSLSPDHLDRYPSVEAYYRDKRRLFLNADAASHAVVSADSADIDALVADVPGRIARFSVRHTNADAWYDRARGLLVLDGAPLLPRADLPLLGDHNVANALAAALAVVRADAAHATPAARLAIADALRRVQPLPHRVAPVHDAEGVLWIDDSKATNVASTLVALAGMTRPVVLLLGGRHKGEPYTALAEPLRRIGGTVLAFGEAGATIVADLEPALAGTVAVEHLADADFAAVVARARTLAQPGHVVLLSPACSSFDMFANYVERGRAFARLARGEHA